MHQYSKDNPKTDIHQMCHQVFLQTGKRLTSAKFIPTKTKYDNVCITRLFHVL